MIKCVHIVWGYNIMWHEIAKALKIHFERDLSKIYVSTKIDG